MKLKLIIWSLFLSVTQCLISQNDLENKILFSVEGTPVYASEFIRVYKKNLDLVQDESQKDVDAYLKLFIDYRLKLQEAKALGYDKKPQYLREFGSYKKQLAKNYLTDHKVTDELVKEAYERVSQDVNVSHMLIKLDPSVTDTTAVYKQMLTFKERLENEDFQDLQKELHNGKSIFVEDLGWFSGFKMIYDFENVAYNTKIGAVSMPFRTQFGYHVLKVHDKRQSRGEVTVGHIMIMNSQKDASVKPAERIQEIYQMLQQGSQFESLAKQFSEDPSSASNGGKLKTFKSAQLSSVKFENEAFKLKNVGEISEPFQTNYGWHIAKLYDKKPFADFEDLKPSLEARVRRDPRSKVINDAFMDTLKAQYGISDENANISDFVAMLNADYYKKEWQIPENLAQTKVLFKIKEETVSYKDFADYLHAIQKRVSPSQSFESIVNTAYVEFLNKKLKTYHENHLEDSNKEYAQILSEYREGLLLFDLMESKIWNAVKDDTIALETYYKEHKANYKWPRRVDAIIISSADKKAVQAASKLLKKDQDIETIKAAVNANGTQKIITTTGVFEETHRSIPKGFKFKNGISKIYNQNDAFHVIKVNEVLPETTKTFEEARGKVIGDYQTIFEKDWVAKLAEKYKITIDEDVLKQVKLQIKG